MIHLDANFLVEALKIGSVAGGKLDGWLAAKEIVGISAVAWAEFRCGPLSKQDEATAERMFSAFEPLTGPDAKQAATLFNQTGRRSRSLADCMIAAVAIRCGARLATLNTGDFQKFTPNGLTFV
jgi:predicted nucleic acid-binding protein